jgi:hypothetical protein
MKYRMASQPQIQQTTAEQEEEVIPRRLKIKKRRGKGKLFLTRH